MIRRNNAMSLFKDKTLMITGGTGSFGNAVLNRFLKTDIGEIRVFSRDEKKQDDMRHDFQVRMPEVADKIKFYSVFFKRFDCSKMCKGFCSTASKSNADFNRFIYFSFFECILK